MNIGKVLKQKRKKMNADVTKAESPKANNVRDLEILVDIHKRNVTMVYEISEYLLNQIGTETFRVTRSDNIHIVVILNDFKEFSFHGNYGMTSQGGNEITIIYKGKIVFRVYWQPATFDVGDCTVKIYVEDEGWRKAITDIFKNRELYLKEYRDASNAKIDEEKKKVDEMVRLKSLQNEAHRLGLTI